MDPANSRHTICHTFNIHASPTHVLFYRSSREFKFAKLILLGERNADAIRAAVFRQAVNVFSMRRSPWGLGAEYVLSERIRTFVVKNSKM